MLGRYANQGHGRPDTVPAPRHEERESSPIEDFAGGRLDTPSEESAANSADGSDADMEDGGETPLYHLTE